MLKKGCSATRPLWTRRAAASGRRAGQCHAGSASNERRPGDGLYGHEYGRTDGRHECARISIRWAHSSRPRRALPHRRPLPQAGRAPALARHHQQVCFECGKPRPAAAAGWTCSCGAVNKGKFCSECGKPKPAGTPKYKVRQVRLGPEDPTHPPKFCPECGDPFDEGDIVL